MRIRKAVITAAGEYHSNLPLQSIVDRAGNSRTVLRCTLDEIVDAGIEEIAIVIRPGQSAPYLSAAGNHASRLVFCEQDEPRGYGDAILRAQDFIDSEAFLHLVSDHLYVSKSNQSCAAQLCEVAAAQECSVSAIQATRENEIIYFGTVGASPVPKNDRLYTVNSVVEKPTPTVAEQELIVPGQRSGYYLCMFGMHVLTPAVLKLLQGHLDRTEAASTETANSKIHTIDLSTSLSELASVERYLALELQGDRYNISHRYGLLLAQLAISLTGQDRDLVLTEMVKLLAESQQAVVPAG